MGALEGETELVYTACLALTQNVDVQIIHSFPFDCLLETFSFILKHSIVGCLNSVAQ